MVFAKLVGCSIGIDEMVPSATKQMGFGREEGSRSMFGWGSSSRSMIPVEDMEKGTLHGSFDLTLGMGSIGHGNGVQFSIPHESFSGGAEGVNLNEKERGPLGNFGFNGFTMVGISSEIKDRAVNGGSGISHTHQKKGTSKKTRLLKGDPEWLPEQRSCIRSPGVQKGDNSVCKRSRPKHSLNLKDPLEEHDCTIVSKPEIQYTTALNSHKDLLLSSGWTVVSQESFSDPIYVSPSGSPYGSLPKALEAFSREASKFREKEWGSSQSVDTSSRHVAKKTHKKKRNQRRTKTATGPVETVILDNTMLQQQELSKKNDKESSSVPVEMGSTEAHKAVAFCNLEDPANFCIKDECLSSEIKKLDLGSVLVADNNENCVTDLHRDDKTLGVRGSVLINGKHVAVNSIFNMEMGDSEEYSSKCVVMLTGDKVKEALPVPEEMGYGQIHEVMAVDEKLRSCIKDKCLNHDKNDCCNLIVIKNDQNINDEKQQDRELQGVRRSVRINGRHVPVDSELDMEMLDGDYSFDSSNSVDILTLDMLLGRQEPDNKENEKEASHMLEKKRYREVREVLASCMVEENARSYDSLDMLMQDMQPPDEEPDKENGNEASPFPEQTIYGEVLEVLEFCMADEKGKSCKDDCLSNETKKLYRSNVTVVKNDQNRDTDIHQDCELVGVRRSSRINGRHVPVDSELDVEMSAVDDFIDTSHFVVKRVAKMDKDTTMISKVKNVEGGLPTTGNIFLKQTVTKKFDYQKPTNQKQLESNSIPSRHGNISKKCDGIKTPVSEKHSPSSKKNGAKALMAEKRSPSSKKNGAKVLMAEKRSPSSASKRKLVAGGCSNGKKKKKRSGGCGLMVRRTKKGDCEENILSETKVCILSWLIESGTLAENERVVYKRKNGKGNILRGWLTGGGIRCNCCKKVLSLSEFEAHAGSFLHQPWNNTCLISGKSLMQCKSEAWEKEKKQRKIGFQTVGVGDADPSDDTCGICADGGHLICCDGCPSTFHQDCVMLKSLPTGSWYCPFCRCTFCMLVDRGLDKSNGTMRLLSCNQCGSKYHGDCVWKNGMDKMSKSLSYCGKSCEKVAAGLSDMIGVSNPIGGGFSWTLVRRLDEEGISSDQRQSFIMECNVKLSLALSVLHECFIPLMDPRTGLDMIAQAVYNCGSNFNRLNYEGFHTVILEKDEELISVATLRLHGTLLAEMPFVGTRPIYRRQGMCRRLLNAIEEMLSSLYVEKLIIPAIPDLLETWMTSFSFKQLELSHKNEIRNLNMILFAETTLLQKSICNENARDEKQVNVFGIHGKGIDRSHHLQNFAGCHKTDVPEYGRQGFKGANLGPCEVIEAPTADDALAFLRSEVSNGSLFKVLPVQSPLVQNTDVVPQNHGEPIPLTSVDIIHSEASVSPEIVSIANRHVPRWLQSADEAKDVCANSHNHTLPLDNLLSIRS